MARLSKAEGKEYFCKMCGKRFYSLVPTEWVYKSKDKETSRINMYCSWHCLQDSRRDKEKNNGRKYVCTY